jgi:nitronate monooxygenase
VLGGSGVPPEEIEGRIARVRELTDRPFGFNMIIADFEAPDSTDEDRAYVGEQISVAVEARVPLIVLFWGSPAPFVEDAHRNGVRVLVQVGSVTEAEAAVSAGVDAVIAHGIEAGGHVRGTPSIWELLPAMVGAVGSVPVLASGGIGDGAGLARRCGSGRKASRSGRASSRGRRPGSTRCTSNASSKAAPRTRSTATSSTSGGRTPHTECCGTQKTFREWDAAGGPPPGNGPGEGTPIGTSHRPWGAFEWPRYATGMVTPDFEGDPEYAPMSAGESCSVVNEIKPAAAIVHDIAREAEALLAQTPAV